MSRLSDELWKANLQHLGVRDISRRAKELGVTLSPSNISNYLRGNHPENPPEKTLAAFAKVFGVPVSDLKDAAAFTGREPFTPDPSSDRLTAPQRAAVNEVIRQLAEANAKAGDGSGNATPTKRAGVSPAPNPGPTADELEELRRRQREADETPLSEILGLAADTGESDAERRAREEGKQQ